MEAVKEDLFPTIFALGIRNDTFTRLQVFIGPVPDFHGRDILVEAEQKRCFAFQQKLVVIDSTTLEKAERRFAKKVHHLTRNNRNTVKKSSCVRLNLLY